MSSVPTRSCKPTAGLDKPYCVLKVTLAPEFNVPFLVVITTTPLAPLDPYKLVEDASFSTVRDSI
jgi:hypothetical protein